MHVKTTSLPARSRLIAWGQFVEMTSIPMYRVAELIDLGWISPVTVGPNEYLFRLDDVYRMKKLERLCRDLEVSTLGGTIIVDLLARIEELETRVANLRRLL